MPIGQNDGGECWMEPWECPDFTENFAMGEVGGEISHTLTITETPVHTHTTGAGTYFINYSTAAGTNALGSGPYHFPVSVGTGSKGGGQSHNNMPPYLTVRFIIAYTTTTTEVEEATPAFTHTLASGNIFSVPLEADIGQMVSSGVLIFVNLVLVCLVIVRILK
jgi:hypothetical protein